MLWRFSIIDRDNVSTVIDEPVGWDQNVSEIKRDLDWHGIVFTNQGDSFQFDGIARKLLSEENNQYGVQGDMTLVLEEDCGNGYEEFGRGKFMFKNFENVCGDECYVKCPVETTTETKDLRNRINQKVDMAALVAFDELTPLTSYDALGFEMELPSKGIFIQDYGYNETASYEHFAGIQEPATGDFHAQSEGGMISLGLNKQVNEIGSFYLSLTPTYTQASNGLGNLWGTTTPAIEYLDGGVSSFIWPLYLSPIVNYGDGLPNFGQISNPLQCGYRVSGAIKAIESKLDNLRLFFLKRIPGTIGNRAEHYEYLDVHDIYLVEIEEGETYNFDYSNSMDITLAPDDVLYFFISNYDYRTNDQILSGLDAFEITFNISSFFKITDLSYTPATITTVFAINEVLSRISESITNNALRAYSEYFGRTDSQPYAVSVDGCGGLEVITDGIRIRKQQNRISDRPSIFAVSLQDVFDGLCPIHNIGMGVEPDSNRAGYNRLRVEPWKHFYSEEILLLCTDVNKISRKTNEKEIFSTFQFGYEKWEAEEYTGLDEFLTKRTYRTTLDQVKNDLPQLSKFIASGYALEITRRKGDNDSKDWRYDKDTFIICCKRNMSGELIVELGNVISDENIIDPETLYNYRISPIRNAMRWMNRVLTSYKQFNSDAKILFTDGDANYYAEGEMEDTNCRLENGPVIENQTIDLTIFTDTNNAKPFLSAERIVFDYPMSSKDYKLIEANPYGLIYFSNNCEEGYGWIDTIQYKPEDGNATFTLIPKAN